MTERCFVKVAFDPAISGSQVRRGVSGFLRYIQHRDQHPASKRARSAPDVAGLVKYVAYRDQANARAELFGPQGSVGTKGRKEFVAFVARSIEGSEPQIFRTRAGPLMDRRRAVLRFLISPESANGLDLERLARAAVSRLESDMSVSGLRWIAAIHRNTDHHHVHLVLAGMRQDVTGGYHRVDITKARLAAMKDALGLEIEQQRAERMPSRLFAAGVAGVASERATTKPALHLPVPQPVLIRRPPMVRPVQRPFASGALHHSTSLGSFARLRAVARRYQRRMQREAEAEARQQWEHAA